MQKDSPTRFNGDSPGASREEFNEDEKNWYEIRIPGKAPERRGYHASFFYKGKFYIHGGHDIREGSQETLWEIDLNALQDMENAKEEEPVEWKLMEPSNKFGPISRHTCVVHGDKAYSYGGSNAGMESRQLYALDLRTFKWEKLHAKGDVPEDRDEHSAVLDGATMVIFGGFCDLGRSNEIFKYYFDDNRWEKIKPVSKAIPSERAGHSAVLHGENMIIFGGKDDSNNRLNDIWSFNIPSGTWTELPSQDAPKIRSGHSASLYKDYMVIFGGIFDVTQELNDMHIYDLKNKRWVSFFEEMMSPAKKKKGAIASILGQ